MQKHTMIIDDQPGLKITDLRARARRMREAYGIEFLVIDYLQLLSGSGSFRNQENRQLEVSEISRLLKTLARELNIPILCLSQLSRKVEERAGHRPMMRDLRESGCLTGDAQIKDAETGHIYTIKELAERKVQKPIFVYGVDKDLKVGKHRMVKAFYSGKKVVYELKTRTGRSIKASANHPFLKLGGWSRLDSLTPGDKIALPNENIFSSELPSFDSRVLPSINDGMQPLATTASVGVVESDVYWDEILSITELGTEDVYDATVENVHNFVANDIIVHNSLEQDSDLVMFLLRREYYDPYDKPGTAELIVAKNRHGGIGSVDLAFRKEIAQFANYAPIRNSNNGNNEAAFSAFSPN
jgi:replicative DNA helicase